MIESVVGLPINRIFKIKVTLITNVVLSLKKKVLKPPDNQTNILLYTAQ